MKKLNQLVCVSVAVICQVCFFCLPGQELGGSRTDDQILFAKIDGLFAPWNAPDTPGVAFVITRGGKIVYKKCFGAANLEYHIPVRFNTSFNLASVSKQFTAFSVLMLEKLGKLDLNDDVRKYLPDLPKYSKAVTLRHLLNHTSGIWEYSTTMISYCGYNIKDHFTLNELMEVLKHQEKLLFEPGSNLSYCNTNYILLAQVVEKITGVKFQQWTKSHIFDPLGMKNSFFVQNSSQLIPNKASPYQKLREEIIDGTSSWVDFVGQAHLFSTIDDMALWMDNFRSRTIGGNAVIDKMFQIGKLNDGRESAYGYGLEVYPRFGKLVAEHSGQTGGYKSFMLYCPDLELGITVLANERSIDIVGLGRNIFKLCLIKETQVAAVSGGEQKFIPFNPESAARYAGGYIIEGLNAKLAVSVEPEFLRAAIFGLGEDALYPISERSFSNRSNSNTIEFLDGKDRIFKRVELTIMGKKMTAHRIILDATRTQTHLADYEGTYYSESFGIGYRFRAENERLIMHHRRYGDMQTQPIDAEEFLCPQGFLKFTRNQEGEIIGFILTPSDDRFYFQGIEFSKLRRDSPF